MKTVFLLLALMSVFSGIGQEVSKTSIDTLLVGFFDTKIGDYHLDIFLNKRNDSIISFEILERGNDKPLRGYFSLDSLSRDTLKNRVHFSNARTMTLNKVNSLLQIEFDKNFCPIEGGNIVISIYRKKITTLHTLHISKTSNNDFRAFMHNDKSIQHVQCHLLKSLSVELGWFFGIREYTFK